VIIRLAPSVRHEFISRAQGSSGITWDEPIRPSSSRESDVRRKDSMSRGRSMTRAPYKGKNRADFIAFVDLEKGDIADEKPEK
jgi:hypothetical protein